MTTVEAFPNDNLRETMQSLLEAPVLLPKEHIRNDVIPVILATILLVSFVYMTSFPLVANRLIPANEKTATFERRRLAYQITNGITNCFIGLLGLYAQYGMLPAHVTVEDKIQGFLQERFDLLGSIHVGFQIWSIIVGVFHVEESTQMLLHHVAVIFAASKSVFLSNGFRYYAPVALGMTEISSVPLAIMNTFKGNPAWKEANPQAFLSSRLIFAFVFLFIRIGIFVPQHLEYLQYTFVMTYWADSSLWAYRLFMSINWLGAFFLLMLQLYWGYLIVRGLVNFVLGANKNKEALEKKSV